MKTGNLYQHIPVNFPEEIVDCVAGSQSVRIERIVSRGHASPDGFWYDVPQREWVMLVSGSAQLRFADGRLLDLKAGDYVEIDAHERHRVESTSQTEDSIWLAVFY